MLGFQLRVGGALCAALVMVGCAAEPLDEEEGVGETQDQLLAGRRVSESEIAQRLRTAGFPESIVPTMVCTAKWESSFYERASNRNRNGSLDRGLFQVNSIHVGGTRGCPTNGEALYSAQTNANCAYAIYKMQGLRAWYGYRAHKSECDNYRLRGSAAPGASSGATDDEDQGADADAGCYSATKRTRVAALACVESASNGLWYQCVGGKWYRGADNGSGIGGACSASYPLED
mgnify:CR=1 FL=1